jgi:cytochrome P450 family 110
MLPPSPPQHPLVQRLRYLADPIGYLDECQRTLGDVFTLRVFKKGMVVVCSPELAKDVYTAGDDVLVAGAAKIAIFGKLLGRHSSVLLDGPEHLKRRRLLLPQFKGEVMKGFAPAMARAAEHAFDEMPTNREFALHSVMHQIAFDVIAGALFSATPSSRKAPLLDALRDFANNAVTSRLLMFPALQIDLGPLSPWGRVLATVAKTRAIVLDEILERRRDAIERNDLVGLLMAAKHDDGSALTDEEIRDEILTMVTAGHETTAMALAWLCYAVFTRPDVLDKLVAELAGARIDDVDNLPYLDAVVRESLRFYSVVSSGSVRTTKKPFRLGTHDIPAGSMLSVAMHSVHRRAGVFERPDEFWPERFLTKKYSPYEAVPFGGGSRRCLGMQFAMFEIKVVLATLLEHYRLEVVQKRVRPSWRGAFLTPSKGLRVRARKATATSQRRSTSAGGRRQQQAHY